MSEGQSDKLGATVALRTVPVPETVRLVVDRLVGLVGVEAVTLRTGVVRVQKGREAQAVTLELATGDVDGQPGEGMVLLTARGTRLFLARSNRYRVRVELPATPQREAAVTLALAELRFTLHPSEAIVRLGNAQRALLGSADDGVEACLESNPFDFTNRWLKLTATGWQAASQGPQSGHNLLLLHGTGLQTVNGFGGFHSATWDVLRSAYNGNVWAFDHSTLEDGIAANVEDLADGLGDAPTIDLLSMSRGGLVARYLAEGHGELPAGVRFRRVVLAASPNNGTRSARPELGIVSCMQCRKCFRATMTEPLCDRPTFQELVQAVALALRLGPTGNVDLQDSSDLVKQLNGRRGPLPPLRGELQYHTITSATACTSPACRCDSPPYTGQPNDLVVNSTRARNPSLADAYTQRAPWPLVDSLHLAGPTAPAHSELLAHAEVQGRLVDWLSAP